MIAVLSLFTWYHFAGAVLSQQNLTTVATGATCHSEMTTKSESNPVADEIISWITGAHAVLRDSLAKHGSDRELYALYYLQDGFSRVPQASVRQPTTAAIYFDETVSFVKNGRTLPGLPVVPAGTPDQLADEVIGNLAVIFAALANDSVTPRLDDVNLSLDLRFGTYAAEDGVRIQKVVHWPFAPSFSRAYRTTFGRLAEALNDPDVRDTVRTYVKTNASKLNASFGRILSKLERIKTRAERNALLVNESEDLQDPAKKTTSAKEASPRRIEPTEAGLARVDRLIASVRSGPLEFSAAHPEDVTSWLPALTSFVRLRHKDYADELEHLHRIDADLWRLRRGLRDEDRAIETRLSELRLQIAARIKDASRTLSQLQNAQRTLVARASSDAARELLNSLAPAR